MAESQKLLTWWWWWVIWRHIWWVQRLLSPTLSTFWLVEIFILDIWEVLDHHHNLLLLSKDIFERYTSSTFLIVMALKNLCLTYKCSASYSKAIILDIKRTWNVLAKFGFLCMSNVIKNIIKYNKKYYIRHSDRTMVSKLASCYARIVWYDYRIYRLPWNISHNTV